MIQSPRFAAILARPRNANSIPDQVIASVNANLSALGQKNIPILISQNRYAPAIGILTNMSHTQIETPLIRLLEPMGYLTFRMGKKAVQKQIMRAQTYQPTCGLRFNA